MTDGSKPLHGQNPQVLWDEEGEEEMVTGETVHE